MKADFNARLSDAGLLLCKAVLLTFAFFSIPAPLHAEDYTVMTPAPLLSDHPSNSSLASADREYRLGLLRSYMRQQSMALLPGLPDELRGTANFFVGQWRSVENGLRVDGEDPGTGDSLASFLTPAASAETNQGDALWVTPGYRHTNGMLVVDDAVLLGFNYRSGMLDNRVRMNVHPFYAQSWHSMESYWGIETSFGIGPSAGESWGIVSVRYNNGSSDLIGHAPGFDIHTDLSFTREWSLSAGAQQNADTDAGSYLLVRWQMKFGEK